MFDATNPPPPLVQATVNDQKLTEPTPSVPWTRVLLTNLRDTCVDCPQGFEAEMVVHKQRADMCNKTLMSSDHWGPFLIKL